MADSSIVKRSKLGQENKSSQIIVTVNDVRNSPQIRQALVSLMEGSVLKPCRDDNPFDTSRSDHSFPVHRWSIADQVLEQNQASWNDELCLLGSRTAIIMPAQKWREFEVSVSSVPSSTLRVQYPLYWGAIERMIEFLIEIRVMALLLEGASYDLLGQIAEKIHQTRSKLFTGNIKIDEQLPELVASAASLRHQAALCQSISHPQLWSRGEFATGKANYLLEQFGVPNILGHIERNINSIVEFVNHIDELYLADLSEKSNENAVWLSMVLAAASLTLTILILPSFWADISQMIELPLSQYRAILPMIERIGNRLAIFLVGSAVVLFILALVQLVRIKNLISQIAKRRNAVR